MLTQPQFIVMETRSLFLSKPSLMAWIKTSFPLGRVERGQLCCPYVPVLSTCTPGTPTLTSVYPPLALGISSRPWPAQHGGAPHRSQTHPNARAPRSISQQMCTPLQTHSGLKHISIRPPSTSLSSRSQAARRLTLTISCR